MTTSLSELKSDVREWLLQLPPGESVIVVDGDCPVARVEASDSPKDDPRPVGICAGQIHIADDFNVPLPDGGPNTDTT